MENNEPAPNTEFSVRYRRGIAQGDPAAKLRPGMNTEYDPANPDTWFNPDVTCYPSHLPGDAEDDSDLTDRDAEADEDAEDGPPPLEEIPANETQDDDMDLSLGEVGGTIRTMVPSSEGQSFTDALIARSEKGKDRMELPQTEEMEQGDIGQSGRAGQSVSLAPGPASGYTSQMMTPLGIHRP